MIRTLLAATLASLMTVVTVVAGDVNSFDVMGLRIGMTADEVEAVAGSKGLAKSGAFPAPSFEQQVALGNGGRVAANDYAGLQSMTLEGEREQVEVFFFATPEGPRAWKIVYRHTSSELTREAMAERVLKTYGPPDKEVMGRAVWGDTALPFSRKSAWLEYDDNPPAAHGPKPVGTLTLADPAFAREMKEAVRNVVR
mgnify:CR=1 FL=1